MTISTRDIAMAVYGSYRLARLDRQGMAFFDGSVEGFWRSFYAALIVAPGFSFIVMTHLGEAAANVSWPRLLIVEGAAYVIRWVAYPLAMVYIADMLDRWDRYLGYIVAYNWSSIIQIAVILPVLGLAETGMVPENVGNLLAVIVEAAILFYLWFIARAALAIGAGPAAALVVFDLILSLFISGLADGML